MAYMVTWPYSYGQYICGVVSRTPGFSVSVHCVWRCMRHRHVIRRCGTAPIMNLPSRQFSHISYHKILVIITNMSLSESSHRDGSNAHRHVYEAACMYTCLCKCLYTCLYTCLCTCLYTRPAIPSSSTAATSRYRYAAGMLVVAC